MNKRVVLFFIGICCLFDLRAQDTSHYDLKRCITYALENSYLKKSNKLEADERFAEYKATKSKILPQIDFYLGYHNYFNDIPPEHLSEGAHKNNDNSIIHTMCNDRWNKRFPCFSKHTKNDSEHQDRKEPDGKLRMQ